MTALTGVVLSLAAWALGVLVQGVVVSEVAHAVVAEKLPLRGVWRRVRPVVGRLLAYAFLVMLAVLLVVAIVVAILIGLGAAALPLAILGRSEEHTSELQSLMRISYAVFCLNKKK